MICGPCGQAADWDRAAQDYADGQDPRRYPVPRPLDLQHCNGLGCMCQHKPIQPKDTTIKGENG